MDEGVRLLELTQKAASLYEKQEMGEKRPLLNFVFSNSTWKGGRTPNYHQPF
jgi:site-specific DNA recombinase